MDDDDFAGLKAGLSEAVEDIQARKAGYVQQVRAATKLTQSEFAQRYHMSVRTLQNWEQGKPVDRLGQVLLRLIERDPVTVDRLLNS